MDVTSALSTISAIGELTKLIISGKIDAEVEAKAAELNNAVLSLQGTLFSLQSQNQELLKEKDRLESELVKMANWDKEAQRYQLHELCSGVFVYALKEDPDNAEPPHYLCPNCYQEHRKSILQSQRPQVRGTSYLCTNPSCGAKIVDYEDCVELHFQHTP